jgi:PadR family transcriptional regulator, regulatory protein PadR
MSPRERPASAAELSTTWLRGVLDLSLLGLLAGGEAYGYELARALEQSGIGAVPGGSLYPALLRLEKAGHLRSEWRAGDGGPGRKYYALTAAGRKALDRDARAWRSFAASLDRVLTEAGAA